MQLRYTQAAKLLAPGIKGGLRDARLVAHVLDRRSHLSLFQGKCDLLFGEL